MKKKTILTFMLCACMVHTSWGAEVEADPSKQSSSLHCFQTTPTKETINLEVAQGGERRFTISELTKPGDKDYREPGIIVPAGTLVAIVIGVYGFITYWFFEVPTQDDIKKITTTFPTAPALLLCRNKCITFRPGSSNGALKHEMTPGNVKKFVETIRPDLKKK